MCDRWSKRFAKDPGQNKNRNEKHHASDMVQIVEQDLHPDADLVYIKNGSPVRVE